MHLRTRWLATALMLASCASSPDAATRAAAGSYELFAPFGRGSLHLHEDATFEMHLTESPLATTMRGTWRADPPSTGWGSSTGVRLLIAVPASQSLWRVGDEMDLLLGEGHATHLGSGGGIDLNWGM